jgi:small GTP-binding protein
MRFGLARRLGLLALVAIPALAAAQQPSAAASAKPRINVVVIGQTGAGKTTLTAAIVKLQASKGLARDVGLDELDHPSTSTARGIALAMSNVEYETEARRYAHVDMPRSADYVKALITGAAKMDGAIVVVSAPDGPMPQTREHIRIARAANVAHVVVYLNKVDLVDDTDQLEIAELETRDVLSNNGYAGDDVTVIRGSALGALRALGAGGRGPDVESIEQLLAAMDREFAVPERAPEQHSIEPHTRFGALAYWLSQQEGGLSAPIKPGYMPQFYFRTADATGAIEMPESTTGRAMPGEYTVIDVSLMAPVAIESGMRFAIRDGGRSVGAGVVVEVRD